MAQTTATDPLDPLAEPTRRVSWGFIAVLSLTNLGIWTAFFAPIQFLLPLQVDAIVGSATKEASLALVLSVGGLVSMVVSPIAGALSDRTASRFGRRRPWVLWASLVAVGVLIFVGLSPILGGLVIGWGMAQLTLNASYAAMTAMIPDQVPVDQRGTVSAMVGVAQPLGVIVGAIISVAVPGDNNSVSGQSLRYVVVAVIVAATALLFFVKMRDPQLKKDRIPQMEWGAFAKSFWISPKKHPDFAWVWLTRFLVMLGIAFVTSYLLFFSIDVLGKTNDEAPSAVLGILVFYIVGLVISTPAIGPISDRVGKVKPFVIGASLVAATAMVILSFARSVPMAIVSAFIMGVGFGAYTAVDLALISRVLPNAEARAQDLGVINIANSGPQVLAPFLAGAIVAVLKVNGYEFAYSALYLTAAVLTLLGAVLVVKVKGVP